MVLEERNWIGGMAHRRKLKRFESPKWVMQPELHPHWKPLSLVCQASERPDCKDGACRDDRYTKSVVNGANRLESVLWCNCLGSVGKRDQSRLVPASIPRADHSDHLATRRHWKSLDRRVLPHRFSGCNPCPRSSLHVFPYSPLPPIPTLATSN